MAGLGWFVGSWGALGFVWVSFPESDSKGFSLSGLTAGVETRFPRTNRTINTIYYGEILGEGGGEGYGWVWEGYGNPL